MVLNALVVYQNLHAYTKSIEYKDFLKTVIHEMLYEYSLGYVALLTANEEKEPPRKKCKRRQYTPPAGAQPSTPEAAQPQLVHGLMTITSTETRHRPQRRCSVYF